MVLRHQEDVGVLQDLLVLIILLRVQGSERKKDTGQADY
jgi:hypothetical protein